MERYEARMQVGGVTFVVVASVDEYGWAGGHAHVEGYGADVGAYAYNATLTFGGKLEDEVARARRAVETRGLDIAARYRPMSEQDLAWEQEEAEFFHQAEVAYARDREAMAAAQADPWMGWED